MSVFIHDTAEVDKDVELGKGTKVWNNSRIREKVVLGDNCIIAQNVYLDSGVRLGDNVKVQNNVSLYHEAIVKDGVFIGPHVCFTNDKVPRAVNPDGTPKGAGDWEASRTVVNQGASIGANSTILPGITLGEWCMIGAGSIITKDVSPYALMVGCPAKQVGFVCKCGERLDEKNHCSKCDADVKVGDA